MSKKYIWWIGESKYNSVGAWRSEEAAEKAIKAFAKINKRAKNWEPIKHEIAICPTCGKLREKDIIEGLGECLSCDKKRGDAMFN